jgi:transposase-like protein
MKQPGRSVSNGKRARWQQLVAAHAQSSLPVRVFCEQHQVHENTFYAWRKRLGSDMAPVRFALVETTAKSSPVPEPAAPLELLLSSGHRLRIAANVDAAILQAVLQALLAQA